MNDRERVRAIMHYEKYDRMPCVAFGYWSETVEKWQAEGHITKETMDDYFRGGDNGKGDRAIMDQLGFDFNWQSCASGATGLMPAFERRVLSTDEKGVQTVVESTGHIVRVKPGIDSIPSEVGSILTGRDVWEKEFLPRLTYSEDRVNVAMFEKIKKDSETRAYPLWLHLGSLYGMIRDMLGIEQLSYLMADDEDLYAEIIDTVANLSYKVAERVMRIGVPFDGAHFWEDICFKNGPLVSPRLFREMVGPHYKRITTMLKEYGVDQVSLDCDGCIDKLVPIWLENGVNTMFPIEVGTWNASIKPWREQYGKALHGVGGMDKRVFARDKAAVRAEIERLKPLIDLGAYIPCPDHRIPPDAEYDLVKYYCELFRATF